jgi:hypothetical protein
MFAVFVEGSRRGSVLVLDLYTPPDHLFEAFTELQRVVVRGGLVLLGFQVGSGEPVHRAEAYGANLPLTNYLHNPSQVSALLEGTGFSLYAEMVRVPALEHETTSQAFVFARRSAR